MFIGATAEQPPGTPRRERSVAPEAGKPASVGRPVPDDPRTRDRVLADVMRLGPVTAAELAGRLDLTPTAVRRHLELLTESGDIAPTDTASRPARRGRGRPARAYVVTPAGHRRLDSDSADVATKALRFLARRAGTAAVEEFARERFAELEERYTGAVAAAGHDPRDRAQSLAGALTADGFAASTRPVGQQGGMDTPLAGVQLCQGHCPMHRVAAEFPQLCEAETAAFSRLLGVHVQRLATISRGEHVCTTFVPAGLGPPGERAAHPLPLQDISADPRRGTPHPAGTEHDAGSHDTNEERTPR